MEGVKKKLAEEEARVQVLNKSSDWISEKNKELETELNISKEQLKCALEDVEASAKTRDLAVENLEDCKRQFTEHKLKYDWM